MLKKINLALTLLSFASLAFSMQCPPASALKYQGEKIMWTLNDDYITHWRVALNSSGVEPNLSSLTKLTAELITDYEQSSWSPYCLYIDPKYRDIKIRLAYRGVMYSVNLKNFTGISQRDYECTTDGSTPAKCKW